MCLLLITMCTQVILAATCAWYMKPTLSAFCVSRYEPAFVFLREKQWPVGIQIVA